ncbi:MAG: ABC transporter ATP-binding protein [Spirochaetales bacterium]|nr:ABC transporter ATP-binding protein [Spirochaetales bacterium]
MKKRAAGAAAARPGGAIGDATADEVAAPFRWGLVRRLLAFLRPYRGRVAVMWIFTLVESGAAVLLPYLMKVAIDVHITAGSVSGLLTAGAAYLITVLVLFAASRAEGALLTRIGYGVLFGLRRDLFARLQSLPFRFYDGRRTGSVMTRLTSDVQVLEELLQGGLNTLFADLVLLVGVIGMMIALDARLSLVLAVILPLFGAVVFWLRGKLVRAGRGIQARLGALNGFLNESITGVKVIRSFAREETSMREFDKVNAEYYGQAKKFYPLNAFFWQSVTTLNAIATALVLLGGGLLLSGGLVSVGVIAAFLVYVTRFFQPMQRLSNLLNLLSRAMASCERIFEILDERPETDEAPQTPAPLSVEGRVAFERVDFGYSPDEPVLTSVSFDVPAGATAAIVGPTGAGKTTIANLLCRFYEPSAGRVLVDGRDLRGLSLRDYRARTAIVMQEAVVFSGTVLDNIRFGRPSATGGEARAVARELGIDDMFSALPDGYLTQTGERGAGLSLGQRQLVAFARALLRDPALLILDEASAYIDSATEKLVQAAMRRLRRGRTTFVIAHRLSTIRDADVILVVDRGRIVESGTHEELLAKSGRYAELLRSQYKAL